MDGQQRPFIWYLGDTKIPQTRSRSTGEPLAVVLFYSTKTSRVLCNQAFEHIRKTGFAIESSNLCPTVYLKATGGDVIGQHGGALAALSCAARLTSQGRCCHKLVPYFHFFSRLGGWLAPMGMRLDDTVLQEKFAVRGFACDRRC